MSTGRLIVGIFLVVIGLAALTGIDLFKFVIPLLFIFLGVRILTGRSWRHGRWDHMHTADLKQDELNEVYVFSGSHKHVKSNQFSGGKAVVIFGGEELDLTDVTTKNKTMELELVAIFGGIKVRVPKGWQVTSSGAGILGAFENVTSGGTTGQSRLAVSGAAIFGGVEIIN